MAEIEKDAINLREIVAKINSMKQPPYHFDFPFTGDGVETEFTVPKGWKPLIVWSAGLKRRSGTGNDYTMEFNGFSWIITFAVAPASGFVDVWAERVAS